MSIETAQERILELESGLEDAFVTIDLLQEALNERTDECRALKGQLKALRNAQQVDYQVA